MTQLEIEIFLFEILIISNKKIMDSPLQVFLDIISPLQVVLLARPEISRQILTFLIDEEFINDEELAENLLIGDYISPQLIIWMRTEMHENENESEKWCLLEIIYLETLAALVEDDSLPLNAIHIISDNDSENDTETAYSEYTLESEGEDINIPEE